MKVQGLTLEQINKVVEITSTHFDNNIRYKKTPEFQRNAYSFTLTVKSSRDKGASINPLNNHRKSACCYHVFFQLVSELFLAGATRFQSGFAFNFNCYTFGEFVDQAKQYAATNAVGESYGYVSPKNCCHCED